MNPNDDINGTTKPEVLQAVLDGSLAREAGGDSLPAPERAPEAAVPQETPTEAPSAAVEAGTGTSEGTPPAKSGK